MWFYLLKNADLVGFFVIFDSKQNIFVCSLDKTRHLKTSPLPAGKLISRIDDKIHQLQAAFAETIYQLINKMPKNWQQFC